MSSSSWSWPEGKVLAIVPTITWETWPDDLGTPSSVQMSNRPPVPKDSVYPIDMWVVRDHLYAEEEGIWRLRDNFARLGISGTVIANGRTVELHPEIARTLRDAGHELASEGWIHNYSIQMTEEQERESVERTVKAFEDVLGQRPRGYISPGHRPTPNTDRIVVDNGYVWEASYDQWDRPHVLDVDGRPLVGMPYGLVDYQTYRYDGRSPRQMAELLEDEFQSLLAEGRAGNHKMMGYVFHPFLSRGYRTRPIFEFLERAQEHDDVWIATRGELADWALSQDSGA
jgi:peptidoglycan/xylan/chitin deacetylase (PgdA/CDA1 family)